MPSRAHDARPPLLYLDQGWLSGIAKRKPAFVALEPVLRAAVAADLVRVAGSSVHVAESAPRPDLRLLELLASLTGGRVLPDPGPAGALLEGRLARVLREQLPERRPRRGDAADLRALAIALPHCDWVACDATMADVVRRAGADRRYGVELFTGRHEDVLRLRDRVAERLAS